MIENKLKLTDIKKLKQRQLIGRVAKGILLAVGAAGFIAAAAMAPNALQMFDDKQSRQKKWYMKKVIDALLEKGLLKKVERKRGWGYEITEKGEELATGYELRKLAIKKQKNWDYKWRIVIADIPERTRHIRDELRSTLTGLGFVPLQKSTWVFPYPCVDVITLLKKKHLLGKQVLYLEVDVLENDSWLRNEFELD